MLTSCLSSQTYFGPIHQGHPGAREVFFLIPDIYDLITFWICNSYGIPIVLLSMINFFNHFIAGKTGVTAIPVITLEMRF